MVASTDDLPARVRAALVGAGILGSGSAGVGIVSDDGAPVVGVALDEGRESAAVWAAVLEVAASELAGVTRSASSWSEASRTQVVDAVDRASRSLTAAKAPILVAQEDAGLWRRPGVRSFEAHLAAKGREDLAPTKREAQAARTLTALEGGLDAAARGEITASHAQKFSAVLDTADPQVRDALQTGEGGAGS
ncbi:MAG: hypothetical protein GX593_02750 [Actinomycetales bacterium]|nr:hypothetical protein [Actinomycetales bacterium]